MIDDVLLWCWKVSHGIVYVRLKHCFSVVVDGRIRGHCFKVVLSRFELEMKKNSMLESYRDRTCLSLQSRRLHGLHLREHWA